MLTVWPILLGWPAILVSITLSVMAIVRNRPAWLVVAAIIVVPFCLYFFGAPRFRWIPLVLPVLLFRASIVIPRSWPWLAWSLLVPFVGFFGWLEVIVISE